jgi:hypothetical protein
MLPLSLLTLAILLPLANTQSMFPPNSQQPPIQQNPTNPLGNQQNPGNQFNQGNQQAPRNQGGAQGAQQSAQASCFQRVSWTTMSETAKTAFINRILEIKKSGEYDLLTQKHVDESASTHGVSMFLPYHRWLLHSLEITMGMAIPVSSHF